MKKILFVLVILYTHLAFSQVGVNTITPNPSSMLDIVSTDAGILIPRVALTDTSDATTITNGNVESLLIYNTATVSDVTPGYYYWNNTQWVRLVIGVENNTNWSLSGNSGTINGTDFLGTTDSQNIDIRVNNITKHRITEQGQIEFLNTGNSVFIGENTGMNDDLTDNQNVFVGSNSGVANTAGFSNSFYGYDSGRFNTTGSSNSFFGENSGLLNTEGDANSFYGQDSGASNTTGTRNSFFGQDSGFSNTVGTNNSYFGENAGINNTIGSRNSFFGQASGFSNISGVDNSFFGNLSGFANTTANNNSFFGNRSGLANTVGADNSFFGFESGTSNTTGSDNSFFGQGSGHSNTTGLNNSFFGEGSGFNNTTANDNSFFGENSGFTNSVGTENSFFGKDSGLANTSGSQNSFIGANTGEANTTGSKNVFLGEDSGVTNITGSNNTFIGNDSGRDNISGSRNSYFGSETGQNATGSDNIFIGYQAGRNETGSDLLFIENSNSTTPLIWGNFSKDLVGINRIATTNALEVGGQASKATAGDWLANSDRRLKKNIQTLNPEVVLQKILSLNGITYEWNDHQTGNPRPEGIQYGFTAQNIQNVFPSLVSQDNQGFLQTAYGTYDAMTVEAIRALYNRIVVLEKENQNLRTENNSFEERLRAIEGSLKSNDDLSSSDIKN